MKLLLFGYGSLINLDSASRTLQRELKQANVYTGILNGYQRNWTLWDDVISSSLEKEVKAVFLNLTPSADSFLNGIMIEISDTELKYFISREKNYECTDVTKQISFPGKVISDEYKVITFVGKKENLIYENQEGFYVFERYIEIVNNGIKLFGHEFIETFNETTQAENFTKLSGTYTFVDAAQQKAR